MEHTITITEQRPMPEGMFEVAVSHAVGGMSTHTVYVDADYVRTLIGDTGDVETLIRRSFDFLLAREPKEAILPTFHLRDIQKYFPQYEEEMRT